MHKYYGKRRLYLALIAFTLAAMACGLYGATETPSAPTTTPTPLAATATPTEAEPVDTSTPTETESVPTSTLTPFPPSPTATSVPATATLDISGWFAVIGTWSGCVGSPDPGVPYYATPCTAPSGNFVTLWIKSNCAIGEYCGNYVKGRFESEYIRLRLTLIGIQGPVVWMHGVSSSPIYSSSDTDVSITRESGNKVRITEKAGQKYIHVLPRGCDSVIVENTGIGCFAYLS
jgi:hypothetical protein